MYVKIDKIRFIISIYFKTLKQASRKAYPCQRQCSLFTHIAADPQFPRFHSLAEIFAKNIKTVVTSCTCQEEKKNAIYWKSVTNCNEMFLFGFISDK